LRAGNLLEPDESGEHGCAPRRTGVGQAEEWGTTSSMFWKMVREEGETLHGLTAGS
jgi:hypothetical protein